MDFVYQGKNHPTKLATMASASNAAITNNQDPWLADSSTSDHLTTNLNNLSIQSQYKGLDQVTMGNGQSLPINHIGNATLHTKYHNFILTDVFHVPRIAMNLLTFINSTYIIIVLVILMPMNLKFRIFLQEDSSTRA